MVTLDRDFPLHSTNNVLMTDEATQITTSTHASGQLPLVITHRRLGQQVVARCQDPVTFQTITHTHTHTCTHTHITYAGGLIRQPVWCLNTEQSLCDKTVFLDRTCIANAIHSILAAVYEFADGRPQSPELLDIYLVSTADQCVLC